ncbi:MAG: methyltransferase domain-containing protein [Deinococcales bacterium]
MEPNDEQTAARWSRRGPVYAVSREHVAGPSLPRLVALARPRPGDRCLDLGTGAGHTAARLAEAGAEVIGIDPARGMLDAARRRYGALPNLRFVEAPGDATGLPSGSFDIVTARHTLHHHADPMATLSEVTRVLKPGGRFVLVDETTPDPRVDAWLDAVERARDATHVRAYGLDEWRAMLGGAGLQWIVGDIETRYPMEVEAWVGRMALDEAGQAEVRRLFRQAGPLERRLFTIEYEAGEAVRFALPMALVLATLPEEGRRA